MRSCLVAVTAGILAATPAWACGGVPAPCGPEVVVFPFVTTEGALIGSLEARVRRAPVLDISPVNGQPSTVIYGRPRGVPGPAGFDAVLVPLPAPRRSTARGPGSTDD